MFSIHLFLIYYYQYYCKYTKKCIVINKQKKKKIMKKNRLGFLVCLFIYINGLLFCLGQFGIFLLELIKNKIQQLTYSVDNMGNILCNKFQIDLSK